MSELETKIERLRSLIRMLNDDIKNFWASPFDISRLRAYKKELELLESDEAKEDNLTINIEEGA